MMDHTIEPKSARLSGYIYAISIYAVFLGVLSLWGYWLTFDIDILEFIAVSDILKSTGFSLAIICFSGVTGILFAKAIGVDLSDSTPPSKAMMKRSLILLLLTPIPITFVTLLMPEFLWLLLPIILASVLSGIIHVKIREYLPLKSNTRLIVLAVCLLPVFAYGGAKIKAKRVINGQVFFYVTKYPAGMNYPEKIAIEDRLRFIGHTGDYMFFLDPSSNEKIILKIENGSIIGLNLFVFKPPPIRQRIESIFR